MTLVVQFFDIITFSISEEFLGFVIKACAFELICKIDGKFIINLSIVDKILQYVMQHKISLKIKFFKDLKFKCRFYTTPDLSFTRIV